MLLLPTQPVQTQPCWCTGNSRVRNTERTTERVLIHTPPPFGCPTPPIWLRPQRGQGGGDPLWNHLPGGYYVPKKRFEQQKKKSVLAIFFYFRFSETNFFFTQNESRLDLKIQALLYRVLLYGMLAPKIPENQGKMDRPIWCLRASERPPTPPIRYSMIVWGCLNVFLAISIFFDSFAPVHGCTAAPGPA